MENLIHRGLILKVTRFAESSAIISVLTENHGLVTFSARGAFRKNSPFRGALEPFAFCEFTASASRNREVLPLSSALIINYYSHIRNDCDKITAAESAIELVFNTVHAGAEQRALFKLVKAYLERLDKKVKYEPCWLLKAAWLFIIHFLRIMGGEPVLNKCVKCGETNFIERIAIVISHGGCVCNKCYKLESDTIWVKRETLNEITALVTATADNLHLVAFIDTDVISKIIDSFLGVSFGRNIRLSSLSILKSMIS